MMRYGIYSFFHPVQSNRSPLLYALYHCPTHSSAYGLVWPHINNMGIITKSKKSHIIHLPTPPNHCYLRALLISLLLVLAHPHMKWNHLITCNLGVKWTQCYCKSLKRCDWPLHVHCELIFCHSTKLQHYSILLIRIYQLEILNRCHCDTTIKIQNVRAHLMSK